MLCAAWPLYGAQPDFAALIQRLDAEDPQSPQALAMHLRYADFLSTAAEGDCAPRLLIAQAQLDQVQANPALPIVLSAGEARLHDVSYRIHLARAACGPAAARTAELRAALAAAQSSAEGYREVFDYVSMATMQYNVALAYQDLGEETQALTALNAALATDREFGFRDDALENTALLLRWRHLDSTAAQLDALMKDFPTRSITLRFAWPAGESDVRLDTDYARLIGGQVLRAHGSRAVTRRIQKRAFHWVVSYQARDAQYRLDGLPPLPGIEASFMRSFAGMLLQFHDIDLIDQGREDGAPDFREALDPVSFMKRVRSEGDSLLQSLPAPGPHAAALAANFDAVLKGAVRQSAEQQAAVDFNLEAGAWPGASLEQGTWYTLEMPLPLPYAPLVLVNHQIEFAFTRQLPCQGDAEPPACVEIVMRAAPQEADLQRVLKGMQPARSSQRRDWQAICSTTIRLITDPHTLLPYLREMRRHAYLSSDGSANGPLSAAEKIVMVGGSVTSAAAH